MATQYEKRKLKEMGPQPNLDRVGYDVVWDDKLHKYMKVVIEYCIVTGEAQVKEVEAIADSQPLANYRMQEIFAKKILGIK